MEALTSLERLDRSGRVHAATNRRGGTVVQFTSCASKDPVNGYDQTTRLIMPTIFDLLYREYCRARLAEMRKQLLIRAESQEVPEANCDTSQPDGAADRGSGLGDWQREPSRRAPS